MHIAAAINLTADVATLAFPLGYPKYWFAPREQLPRATELEQQTLSWIANLGVAARPEQIATIRAMCPQYYGGCPFSMLPFDNALAITRYLTMWLLWDDELAEVVDDIAVLERDLAAMEGRLFPGRPPTPYQHAWLQVGDTLMRLGASVSLRNRWIRAMREFTVYAIEEGKIRRGVVADNRSMDEAIDMRRYTIGLKPTLIYLEACCGAELPDSVLDSAKYLELCYHILAVQGLQNDLASMAKDFEEGHIDTNMVLRFRQRSGASLQKSCETIMAIHDASVRQFDLAAEALVEEAGAAFRARLSTYLDHIRYMQTGFGFFHMHAHRYTQIMAVERNLAHRIDLICH